MSHPVRRVARRGVTVLTLACASVYTFSLGGVRALAQAAAPTERGASLISPAPGGRVRVVDASVQGADTMAPRFRPDTGVFPLPSLPPCGQRPCAPGAALRAARVTLPAARVPIGITVPVSIEFENRGRVTTAPVDVRVDFTNPIGPESRDVFTLRALRPGERVRVVRPLRTPQSTGTNVVGVWRDQRADGQSGLAPGDGLGQSETFRLEGPVLQWARVDIPTQVPSGAPVRIGFVIRNTAVVAAAPATEVELRRLGAVRGGPAPDPAGYRFTLPPLPPGAVLTATVDALDLTRGTGFFDVWLVADPDRAHKWGGPSVSDPTRITRVQVGAVR